MKAASVCEASDLWCIVETGSRGLRLKMRKDQAGGEYQNRDHTFMYFEAGQCGSGIMSQKGNRRQKGKSRLGKAASGWQLM